MKRPSARMHIALSAVLESGEYGVGPACWTSYHTAGTCEKLGYVQQDAEGQTFLTDLGRKVVALEPLPPQNARIKNSNITGFYCGPF